MDIQKLRNQVECYRCGKVIDELEVTEDLILCRTLFIARCHGQEQKINQSSLLDLDSSVKIQAFYTE